MYTCARDRDREKMMKMSRWLSGRKEIFHSKLWKQYRSKIAQHLAHFIKQSLILTVIDNKSTTRMTYTLDPIKFNKKNLTIVQVIHKSSENIMHAALFRVCRPQYRSLLWSHRRFAHTCTPAIFLCFILVTSLLLLRFLRTFFAFFPRLHRTLYQFLGTWYEVERSFYLPELASGCTTLTFQEEVLKQRDNGLPTVEIDRIEVAVKSINQWYVQSSIELVKFGPYLAMLIFSKI